METIVERKNKASREMALKAKVYLSIPSLIPASSKHFWNFLAQPPFQFLRHLRKLFLLLSNHILFMTKNMFSPAWSSTLFSHQLRL